MSNSLAVFQDSSKSQKKADRLHHSTLVSRNVVVADHRTSVRLEPEMWDGLKEICRRERATLHQICSRIAQQKDGETSLTAAIRVFVMHYYRLASTEEGHAKAGHGMGLTLIRMGSQAFANAPMNHPAALLTKTSFA